MIVVKAAVMDSMTEQRALARNNKVPEERVNKASIVLQYAPELVDSVIHGGSLDSAEVVNAMWQGIDRMGIDKR